MTTDQIIAFLVSTVVAATPLIYAALGDLMTTDIHALAIDVED